MDAETYPSSWLVLLAQLPSKPSSARVAMWRRMRAAGATPVVNSAWMLPRTTAHEDFFEQSREGVAGRGGTGFVLRVSGSSPESNESIVRLFQSDRSREYDEFAERCAAFLNEINRESAAEKYTFAEMEESEQDLKKLARWLAKIQARDFSLMDAEISQPSCWRNADVPCGSSRGRFTKSMGCRVRDGMDYPVNAPGKT
jgi:hypothetical protein